MKIAVFGDLNDIEKIVNKYDYELVTSFETLNDSAIFISSLETEFLPNELINIFKKFVEQRHEFEIKLVLAEFPNEDARAVLSWIKLLNDDFGLKVSVVAEIDKLNLKDDFEKVLKTLNEQNGNKASVEIYTDGACSGNPGPGGWGAVLLNGKHKKEISGFDKSTTNNQMELLAVIKALEMLKTECTVNLYSDSAYVVNAINQGWLSNWQNNNWLGADKKPVKNQELWERLSNLLDRHEVIFHKVKGHADNELNNRCDELATGEIEKHSNQI
ncbi:MAG: ribonuclease HI [Clostridia bacterium]|nr:ribonuclease HI [Clostridia bacterium]